MEVPVHH